MKTGIYSILTIALAITLMSCGGSPKGKVLVSVGGDNIFESDMEFLSNLNPRIKAQMATKFGKKKILDNLVEQELLYKASINDNLDKDPTVKDKLNLYRRVIISQAFLDKKLQEKARKFYDEHKGEFEKAKLSDILIKFKNKKDKKVKRSPKEALKLANKIKEKIEKGEDFAKAAKESSEDTMTNKRGGDLGFASKNEPRLVRRGYGPLLEKAFTMKVGEIAGPIKTEQGYHIITLTKGVEQEPFDKAEQKILFKIRASAKNEVLADLKKEYPVVYVDGAKAKTTKVKASEPAQKGKKKGKKDIKPTDKPGKKN